VLWAADGDRLTPIPAWALRSRRVATIRIWLSRWLPLALAAMEWAAAGLLTAALLPTCAAVALACARYLRHEDASPELFWILAISFAINVVGIRWDWNTIEVTPLWVYWALVPAFSHGWAHLYPPLHFAVLALVTAPAWLLMWLGRVGVNEGRAPLLFVNRAVSLVMAAGIVCAVYVSCRMVFGRRAALFAAALFALVAPFVFYAKLANVDVPYVFWASISLVFYLRILSPQRIHGPAREARPRDYAWFAATAMFAICTKDQAYGLYVLTPFVIVWEEWRRQPRERRSVTTAIFNRRIGVAILVGVAAFLICDNVIFNYRGFITHVQMITGAGSQAYQAFDATLAGRWDLFKLTVDLSQQAMGWPFFVASVSGAALALLNPIYRRAAIWLLVPIVSYYFTFIDVVLYNYDRFMLLECVILALFGGFALAQLTAAGAAFRWRAAVAGAAFAYTLIYSATVDVLMVRDSRYDVEHWFAARLGPDDTMGIDILEDYLPRVPQTVSTPTVAELQALQPSFAMLNVDYMRGVPRDTLRGTDRTTRTERARISPRVSHQDALAVAVASRCAPRSDGAAPRRACVHDAQERQSHN
jgi:hypothetical protein